jgi:hypothetical protein
MEEFPRQDKIVENPGPVLRIRCLFNPGSGIKKKSDSGSRI